MSVSILVVEDDAEIRDRVRFLLESAGYVVHTANDPEQALDIVKRLPRPCLLLWDAVTPRTSLTMVNQATLVGVHVAALPVSVSPVHLAASPDKLTKRLTSEEAILNIVREHCPLLKKAAQ
jgi:two-component system, OmpR family, response regulator CpxR